MLLSFYLDITTYICHKYFINNLITKDLQQNIQIKSYLKSQTTAEAGGAVEVAVGLMPSYDVVLEDIAGGTVRMPFDELASPNYRFA